MEDTELIICLKSLEELKPQLGVWASMCPSPKMCLGIRVTMTSRQVEELFYKIWEKVGDTQISKWIEAEGYRELVNKQ